MKGTTFVKDQKPIGIQNGVKAMGNGEDGAFPELGADGGLDEVVGLENIR